MGFFKKLNYVNCAPQNQQTLFKLLSVCKERSNVTMQLVFYLTHPPRDQDMTHRHGFVTVNIHAKFVLIHGRNCFVLIRNFVCLGSGFKSNQEVILLDQFKIMNLEGRCPQINKNIHIQIQIPLTISIGLILQAGVLKRIHCSYSNQGSKYFFG